MKKKVLSICISLALIAGMIFTNDVNVQAEGGYEEGFQVTMTTNDTLSAGAKVTFAITVTNKTDKKLNHFSLSHDWYNRADTSGIPPMDSGFGQMLDEYGNDIDQNLALDRDIEFAPGETKTFSLTGTLPIEWGAYYQIWIIAYGRDSEDPSNTTKYTGSTGTDFDPEGGEEGPGEDEEPVYEEDYQVTVTPDKEVKPGERVSFYVSITNKTKVMQQVTWMHPWYYQEIDNSETYPGVVFGETQDAAGKLIINKDTLNISDISFAAGETKEYMVTGTIPATWGKKSSILVVVRSEGADGKEYGGQGEYRSYADVPENINGVVAGNAESILAVLESGLVFAVLTAQELASGDDIQVVLNTNIVAESSVSAKDKASISKAAGERKIAQILDLTIQKKNTTRNTEEAVTKLSKPIVITVQIPEKYRNVSGREFSVIRLHEDEAVVLQDLDTVPETVTFSTDEFSLYTLAYTDKAGSMAVHPGTVNEESNGKKQGTSGTVVVRAATPRTGDTANVMLYLTLCLVMAGAIFVVFIKKKRAGERM